MSNADVGDAVEVAFTTTTGATVNVTWTAPDGTVVVDHAPVTEDPGTPGSFPTTLTLTTAGVWEALFTASGAATAVERFYVRAISVTGPPPLAVLGDVSEQFGTMTTAQTSLTNSLLRAASKLVRQKFPAVDTHIASGKLDGEVVALAVTNMVLRVLRNPKGVRAETTGPFSTTYDTTVAAGQIEISPDEVAMLTPQVVSASQVVGSIVMKPGMRPYPRELRELRWRGDCAW